MRKFKTRREFVQDVGRGLLMLLVALTFVFLGRSALAQDTPETVVYPTGIFPDDVQNVQTAVSGGGRVLLKAVDQTGNPTAFNFGPPDFTGGRVLLKTDVEVLGSTDGEARTTIHGGSIPMDVVRKIRFKIQGLQFVNPGFIGIFVLRSADAVIADNVVRDVVPVQPFPDLYGIAVAARFGHESDISGNVVITRNIVDGVHAQPSYGILAVRHDANAVIEGNRVRNVDLNGILVGVISQTTLITRNLVEPGANNPNNFGGGNGIFVGHFRGGHVIIRSNQVICANPGADGIGFIGGTNGGFDLPVDGSLVEENEVTMHGSLFGGISLYDTVSNVTVTHNTIRGDGAYALQVGTADFSLPASAVANTFRDNEIHDFRFGIADIFLNINAADTLLCDEDGTLLDHGTGTQIVSGCSSHKD